MNNWYRIKEGVCYIQLDKENTVLIDAVDLNLIKDLNWTSLNTPSGTYAKTGTFKDKSRKTVLIHHLILEKIPGIDVDHINRNTLDNRRSNLRYLTRSNNCLNCKSSKGATSKYLGVSYIKKKNRKKKWLAQIMINRKIVYTEEFVCERDAGIARAKKFVELLGPWVNPDQTKLSKESV